MSMPGCADGFDDRDFSFMTMGPSLGMEERERWDPPDQVVQKHLYQQAHQPAQESFKLEIMRVGDEHPHSSGEVVDLADK